MKLAVSMIVLDDERWIGPCIESLAFADGIFIIDGGSTDATVDILREKRADGFPIKVDEVAWQQHFGAQRNHALDMVSPDYSWVMRVDADERVGRTVRDNIKEILLTVPGEVTEIRVRQCNLVHNPEFPDAPLDSYYAANLGGFETWPRIFKLSGKMEWSGQVHEHMYRDGEAVHANANFNAPIIHYGWLDEERLAVKEQQYMNIPGSGFYEEGALTGRHYAIREVPPRTV